MTVFFCVHKHVALKTAGKTECFNTTLTTMGLFLMFD